MVRAAVTLPEDAGTGGSRPGVEPSSRPSSPRDGSALARLLLVLLLVTTFAGNLAFIHLTDLDLFPDEAQYWDWSRRPGLSYYSKPPLIAYAILASCALTGESTPVSIRLPAVVLGVLSTFLVYLLARLASGSDWAGLAAACAFRLAPLYVSESVVMTTDCLLVFFWGLLAISLHSAAIQGRRAAWLAVGLSAALGFLSKYTMALCLPWIWAVARRAARGGKLRGHGRYIAGGVAFHLLALVPPLLWNALHDWASFRHVAGNAGKSGHLAPGRLGTALEFLASQLGVITPVLFCLLVWALWRSWKSFRASGDPEDHFLLWGTLPLFAVYLGASFLGRAEANWAAACYLTAFAALARHLWGARRRLVIAGLVAAVPFTALAYDFDLVYGLGLKLAPRQNPTMRMRGWKELGAAVGAELTRLHARGQPQRPFVLAATYQVAAELAFYTPGRPIVHCANVGRRRSQYDYWPGFESFLGRDAVYVAAEGDFPHPHHMLRRAFERYEKALTVVYEFRGEPALEFSVFRMYGFRGIEPWSAEEY